MGGQGGFNGKVLTAIGRCRIGIRYAVTAALDNLVNYPTVQRAGGVGIGWRVDVLNYVG